MTIFVAIVLTADEAKAAANACASVMTAGRGLFSLGHPVFTAALAIEDAMVKAGAMDPLPRHLRNKEEKYDLG
jgi:hypothetical protein